MNNVLLNFQLVSTLLSVILETVGRIKDIYSDEEEGTIEEQIEEIRKTDEYMMLPDNISEPLLQFYYKIYSNKLLDFIYSYGICFVPILNLVNAYCNFKCIIDKDD